MDVTAVAEACASADDIALPDEFDAYRAFLEAKIKTAAPAGLPCSLDDVPETLVDGRPLKPHQRALIRWAVEGGQRALFEAFGLGKSIQQLLIICIIINKLRLARQTVDGIAEALAYGLIVCPLGVRREFMRDAALLGIEILFVQSDEEIEDAIAHHFSGLFLTNYESIREGKITVNRFRAVSLDEASVLRSYGSKTFQTFLPLFTEVPYRFVATATPSPNRYKELIHYAGFLGVMDTGQALTRFFKRDSTSAGNLQLYEHKEEEFFLWLNSWGAFLQMPSDLGFDDTGYDLPPITVRYHMVQTEIAATEAEPNGQGRLLRDAAIGVTQAAAEKRSSLSSRVAKAAEIVNASPADHFILWHDLEDERRSIEAMLPSVESVYGTQELDQREGIIERFATGLTKLLAAKPVMLGSGTNLQRHCHRAIFVGIGFKFNDMIQAIHRLHRFQQEHPVEIDIIYAETETEVLRDLQAKWARHEELTARMSDIIRRFGLNHAAAAAQLKRTIDVARIEHRGEGWTAVNNDCVPECQAMADNSVDLIVTSIPFGNHYEYSASYRDFGHTDDHAHFFGQMDHLTPELLRILKPGRIACVHVKDRIRFASVTGMTRPTVEPFHADTIAHFLRHGFGYMGLHFISTDVVRENNQTYRLTYKELKKDSSKMGCGSPEFLLVFFKLPTDMSNGYADDPVGKDPEAYSLARWQIDAEALWRSSGDRPLTSAELAMMPPSNLPKTFRAWSVQDIYDHEEHVGIAEALAERDALPKTFASVAVGSCRDDVWTDIARMQTLNGEQTKRALENHICLARGSLVLTWRGFIPIEDVIVGDLALTHKGRWRRVSTVANTGVRPVVDLRAQGVASLALTPDHKVWARKSDWARSRDGAERAEPGWVRTDEMATGYVNLKLPPVKDAALTDQECWLIGRWLADGHIGTRGDFHVSIGREKLAEFERMAGGFAGARAERIAVQFRLKGLSSAMTFALESCGHGANDKQIPPALLALPESKARALLDGYLSGDGHLVPERHRWMASSVSRALLLGVAMLAQRVHGAVATLRAGRRPGETTIEGRKVQTQQEWILSFDLPGARRKKPFLLDDGAWKKVRSVEPAGEVETWCLQVEEDESFTAEGCIVKNCPLQFDIVDRCVRLYSNAGDLVLDPFGGLMTVPVRALKLGRRGYGIELNPTSFRDGLTYLRETEAERAVPSLFDLIGVAA